MPNYTWLENKDFGVIDDDDAVLVVNVDADVEDVVSTSLFVMDWSTRPSLLSPKSVEIKTAVNTKTMRTTITMSIASTMAPVLGRFES